MRRMKKLISVLLVLVMALALCPVTASAAASDYRVGDKNTARHIRAGRQ